MWLPANPEAPVKSIFKMPPKCGIKTKYYHRNQITGLLSVKPSQNSSKVRRKAERLVEITNTVEIDSLSDTFLQCFLEF